MIGNGRYSTIIPKIAPAKAIQEITKTQPPKNAKRNPPIVPSNVFARLNGSGFPVKVPPINDAVLSPKAKIAMAA